VKREEPPSAEEILEQEKLPIEQQISMLEQAWSRRPGFYGWLTDTDHKSLAAKYLLTCFVFFCLAGLLALAMRIQLALPENRFLSPDLYNQFFTVHGTTMMFLFAVPVMLATGLYFVPLMVGTRDVAFPRLNLYGYYVFLIGGLLLWISLLLNMGPDAGWFAYVPLSGPAYAPGKRVDVWAQMITFTEISAIVAAIEIIVTVFKLRCPGMTLNRVPIFVWGMVVTAFMVIFAMPSVMSGSMMLAMDRLIATQFFNPREGGDSLLWQHLFWWFGHPEVYIIFIPAMGMMSNLIHVFSQRKVFGHLALVLSLVATGFLGFGLWVHHMFTTGLPQLGQSYFTAASMMISIPTGVQVFCWIATMWAGQIRWATPMYYIVGWFVTFIIGGLTGVMTASVPLNWQVHDTFFVVAHLHYVLIGGSVFPLLASLHYWWPDIVGRMLDERLGKISAVLIVAGFNLTFFPMHQLGLQGMARRVYTYKPETGWGTLNMIATIGAFVILAGLLISAWNYIRSLRQPKHEEGNPWNADTLDWALGSPAPRFNFHHIPVVEGRYALWDKSDPMPVVNGLAFDCREVLVTSVKDAVPESRYELPADESIWPVFMALATGIAFIGGMFTMWGFVAGGVAALMAGLGWFWPKKETGVQ
jgi:cytochrome c oxidase subunit I+III